MWDLQLSNWMIGLAGSGATVVAIIVFAMFAYLISQRVIAIRDNEDKNNKKHYLALFGIFFVFINLMMVMFTFQSNAPKYRLNVREPIPVQAEQSDEKDLPAIADLSPQKLSPEQSSKRLEELRKKQKEGTSIDDGN